MNDKQFLELAKNFLKLSFRDIYGEYQYLSEEEKELVSKADFELFIKKLNNDN